MAVDDEVRDEAEEAADGQLSEADFTPDGQGGADAPAEPGPEGGGTPAQADQPPPTIRSLVQDLGYKFGPDVADDYAALAHLTRQATRVQQLEEEHRRADVHRQLGQQLAPRAQEIGQFLQQQQQKPAGPKPYEPPEFDQRWIDLIQRDPGSGLYVGKPGTPPEIVSKANAWAEWQVNFQRNPAAVLRPMMDEFRSEAVEQAKNEIRAALEVENRTAAVRQIAERAATWAYAHDQAGNMIPGQLTPTGQHYVALVQDLARKGVQDPVARDEIARAILRDAIPQPRQGPTEDTRKRAQQATRGNRNPLQALDAATRKDTPYATEPDAGRMSLGDMMRREFANAGIEDGDFRDQ